MNQFLKKALSLFALVVCVNAFAQDGALVEKEEKIFNPKFTLGSGFYTLTSDVVADNNGLGRAGFNVGMKFDFLENLDLSLLFIKASFSGENAAEDFLFSSDVDGIGLHLGYSANQIFKKSRISPLLSFGLQRFNVRNSGESSSVITIPLGLGLRMEVADRLQFDFALNYAVGLGDIDMYQANNGQATSDGYKSLNIAIHYDLFSPKEDANLEESYYADVNFTALDLQDSDGDLVLDIDDYCPETPIGVKVNESGCPLDGDNDGIPDYIDDQKNTQIGAVVDEKGVQLTEDKYYSMYSDYEAASREYANFYNENEIRREDYKTVDEYLIAKANAFNKAYNEGKEYNNTVKILKYRVKIGEYSEGIPANIINKYLSLDDLKSLPQDNSEVIYAVGAYESLEDAFGREHELESKGFKETSIIVDNNGVISSYVPPVPEPMINPDEEVLVKDIIDSNEVLEQIVEERMDPINNNTIVYRIQIGAVFKVALSEEVFNGVDNVISFTGKDGYIRYMTGSFTDYKDAISYKHQMQARGFEDAFIVTYKAGKRINLDVAIKTEKNRSNVKKEEIQFTEPSEAYNVEFIVQILVNNNSLDAEDLRRMTELGNIEKETQGTDMVRYFIGTYTSLEEANSRVIEAKELGFNDAFLFAKLNGERITLEKAKTLLIQKE